MLFISSFLVQGVRLLNNKVKLLERHRKRFSLSNKTIRLSIQYAQKRYKKGRQENPLAAFWGMSSN
jgi:hypothetical protein